MFSSIFLQFDLTRLLQRCPVLSLLSLYFLLVSEREKVVRLQTVKFVDSPLLRLDIILLFKSLIYNMTLLVDEMLLLFRGLLEAVIDLSQDFKFIVQLFISISLSPFLVGKLLDQKLVAIHASSFRITVNIFV
jgi:hypothetical protein